MTNQVNVSGTVTAISYKKPPKGEYNGATATVLIDITKYHAKPNVVSVKFSNRQADILNEYVRPGHTLAVAGELVGCGRTVKIFGTNFNMLSMKKTVGVAV